MKDTLKSIATLQSNSTGVLFEIGKQAAVATAVIDGISAVQKALASAPPPINFVLAGIVGAATVANVIKIESTQPPKLAGGGIVPGPSSGDTVPVLANGGEMMLNMRDQVSLLKQIRSAKPGGGGQGPTVIVQGHIYANNDAEVDRLLDKMTNKLLYKGGKLRGATS
jgi:hypothetical protein